jgi:hypothetical protein
MRPIASINKELFEDADKSYLSADVAAGESEITVESIKKFAVNKILFIGELGNEKSEIIKTHSSTSPSGSTVTLASVLLQSHQQGTVVYIIDYDQVELSHATAVDGTKTVIETIDIDPQEVDTIIKDSTYDSGYYFVRFKNSIDGTFSAYSDPAPYSGWEENQVAEIIQYALKRNKLETYTDNVNESFCISEINACLNFIKGKLKKWSELQNFDYSLGARTYGLMSFDLPDTCYDKSKKSILGVRVGKGRYLTYKDKQEWQEILENIGHTTAVAASIGDITLEVDDSTILDDSGTIKVKGVAITYTDKDDTTNTLSGIPASGTGSITATISTGDDVWQGNEEGEAEWFTIIDGKICILPLTDSANNGLPVLLDFWKEIPLIDSESDQIENYRYDMVKFWLTWAIRGQISNAGKRDIEDGDFKIFSTILSDAVKIEVRTQLQKNKSNPVLNKIRM